MKIFKWLSEKPDLTKRISYKMEILSKVDFPRAHAFAREIKRHIQRHDPGKWGIVEDVTITIDEKKCEVFAVLGKLP